MKKIGILTYHFFNNYGAVLQAAALNQVLHRNGFQSEIIDFRLLPPAAAPGWFKSMIVRRPNWTDWKGKFTRRVHYSAHVNAFEKFRNQYLTLSQPVKSREELEARITDYSGIVVGSDQVWNIDYHIPDQDIYFFNFRDAEKIKKICYAPCCGNSRPDHLELSKIAALRIPEINCLSVRNQATCDFVKAIAGRTPEIVCDPTILYDFKDEIQAYPLPEKEYILAYFLNDANVEPIKILVSRIRKQYPGVKIVAVVSTTHQYSHPIWADRCILDAGPGHWLALIKDSRLVLTNSFHGQVFAAKYNIPYAAVCSRMQRERFADMKSRFKLEYNASDTISRQLYIHDDYSESSKLLAAAAVHGMRFLKDSLSFL